MKVLLVTQEFPPNVLGGVGYHAYHVAAALVDRGHDVHVLTGDSDGHAVDDSMPAIPGVTSSTLRYRRTLAPRLWFARRARRWLQSWSHLDEYDVVHAHEYLDFAGFEFGGTTVQKVHFNLTEKPRFLSLSGVPRPLRRVARAGARATIWRAERRLERRAIETADVTIANSRLTRSICRDRHGLDGPTIEVVHNGVDLERFSPPTGAPDADYLLFVGGDEERKGFPALREAVRRLESPPALPVKVVGSVASVDTDTLESTTPFEFLGRVSHGRLEALYRHAAALVHPALYEPFGNVVLEALACGTPAVVSDVGHCGAAELLDDATGIRVDPNDASALAEAMLAVVDASDRFSATRCRALAERHSWDAVAERTMSLVAPPP